MITAARAETETRLEEVVVSARADAQEARRHAPTAKIVFHREDLEALDAATVAELLRLLPGTGMHADMEGKRGRKKGPDKHMPRILVDGEALPGGDRSPGSALRLPANLIERVEIIRNASAEFPAAGSGGTINLVLRDVPPKASRGARVGLGATDGHMAGRADGQYGNTVEGFGYLWSGAVESRPRTGATATEVQRFSAGSRSEWRFEADEESGRDDHLSLAPRFTWNLGGGRRFVLSPMLMLGESERGTATRHSAYADPLAGAGLAHAGRDLDREDGRRNMGRLSGEWKANLSGGGEWSARLTLQAESDREDKTRREYDALDVQDKARDEARRREEREVGVMLKAMVPLGETHLLSVGLDGRRKTGEETRRLAEDGLAVALGADGSSEQSETRLALWAQDEWQLAEGHLLTPGLRWESSRVENSDGLGVRLARDHRALAPSLHYLWQPTQAWNLRASLSLSDKAPGLKELSGVVRTASGDNAAANPDKAGNPSLDAERTLGLEAGVEHFLSDEVGNIGGNVGLNLFLRRVENQVQKLTLLEGARWVERPYNVGEALQAGAVLDYKVRLDALPGLTLRGNLSHSHTRLRNTPAGLGAGEGPRSAANLGFDYEIRDQRLTLGGNLNASSALKRENTPQVRQSQGARHQLDLYALKKLDKQLALRFTVSNATDAVREEDLEEYAGGALTRLEHDRAQGAPGFLVTLEGKW